jgi:hypothetical protein
MQEITPLFSVNTKSLFKISQNLRRIYYLKSLITRKILEISK